MKDVEKEAAEINEGLRTHWCALEELRNLFETCGFRGIEVVGDGLLASLLLEGSERLTEFMRQQPEMLLEIEKRLAVFLDPNKTPTIIVKSSKR